MTVSVWFDKGSKIEEEFDVAVIGAGVAGASAAFWLGKRRGLATVVLDDSPSKGATGRSAGFVLRGIFAYYNQAVKRYGRETAAWIFRMNEETLRTLAEIARGKEDLIGYQPCGSYLLSCSLDELQELKESADLMLEDGFEVEYLRDDPLDRGYYGALHSPDDVAVNPLGLVRTLLSSSAATVYDGEEVFRIEASSGKITIHGTERIIRASRVLILTNAYAPTLLPNLAPVLEIVRGQALVTRPLKEKLLDKICYANYGYEYFRQLNDGRFLLGGCREPFHTKETGYGDVITAQVQTALQHYLRDRFPEIAGSAIDYRWSGLMAFTRDGLPLIGEVADKPGVFYAVGCNGHGLGYSLALSKLLVDVALDDADAGIFDASREAIATS